MHLETISYYYEMIYIKSGVARFAKLRSYFAA